MTARPVPTIDSTGQVYQPADGFEGGWYTGPVLQYADIKGTDDDSLYRPTWVEPRGWHRPVPQGTYNVTLKMREAYNKAEGQRVFDVQAEGKTALSNVDLFKIGGFQTAVDQSFTIKVTDGMMNLKFIRKRGLPIISAIALTLIQPSSDPKPSAPGPALSAGYTNKVLYDEFTSLDTIDLTSLGDARKTWFTDRPFGWGRTHPESLRVKDSVLTINPTTDGPNYGIGTTSPTSRAGRGFRYGYFEARMAFNPADAGPGYGFPSFWGVSHGQILGAGKNRSSEIDFFEAYREAGRPFEKAFAGTVHDLVLTPSLIDRANYGNNVVPMPDVDWTSFHTYGCLWSPGEIVWYFDNKPIIRQQYSRDKPPFPNQQNLEPGIFSELDEDTTGQTVVLGTGVGFPLRVDWIKVWQ